VQNNSIVHSNL